MVVVGNQIIFFARIIAKWMCRFIGCKTMYFDVDIIPNRLLTRKGFLKRLDVMLFFVFAPYFGSFRLFFQLFSSLNVFKNNQK